MMAPDQPYNAPLARGNSQQEQQQEFNQAIKKQKDMTEFIKLQAHVIFDHHDRNRSGKLDDREMYAAIVELFQLGKSQIPTYAQSIEVMKQFDADKSGLIDKKEFEELLLVLCGLRQI